MVAGLVWLGVWFGCRAGMGSALWFREMVPMRDRFSFAGFSFPRTIPEFFTSRYNVRSLSSGRSVPARMRFAYSGGGLPGAGGSGFYLASDFAPGLRWVWCDKVSGVRGIDHTGWFCDEYGDGEKIRGVVFRLPRGRGFLAGWSMGESMASLVEYRVLDDEIDAAHAADSLAEYAAEREREYQASHRDDDDGEVV